MGIENTISPASHWFIPPNPELTRKRAISFVCGYATDAEEAKRILEMLGLLDGARMQGAS